MKKLHFRRLEISVIFKRFDPGQDGYWTLALDDSPTKRYGRHVEAANIHHNPTPGPGDGDWLYGHHWVCLAMVLTHPVLGVIALPQRSSMGQSQPKAIARRSQASNRPRNAARGIFE